MFALTYRDTLGLHRNSVFREVYVGPGECIDPEQATFEKYLDNSEVKIDISKRRLGGCP